MDAEAKNTSKSTNALKKPAEMRPWASKRNVYPVLNLLL
jgi:hypothetical protein